MHINYRSIEGWKSDITQLAACSETTCIAQSKATSSEHQRSQIFLANGNQMFHINTAVQYKLVHEALTYFIIFISFHRTCIFVGHNSKRFDTHHVLYNQLYTSIHKIS